LLIIASELADRTLRHRLNEVIEQGEPGIPRGELIGYLAESAEAIDYLNRPPEPAQHRVQHRDIKPENIFLTGGHVKVGDLGLARSVAHGVTGHTGSMTVAYAAPEFIEGKTSDRSDQYSLAVTYCYLRSGRLPFDGNHAQIIAGHLQKRPDLSTLPVGERPVVERALSKAPKDRWPSSTAFVKALRSAGTGESAEATVQSRGRGRSERACSRRTTTTKRVKLVLGVMVAALVMGSIAMIFDSFPGEQWGPSSQGNPSLVPTGSSATTTEAEQSATHGTSTKSVAADLPKELTVAVLDFENHSQVPSADGCRFAFRDMLTTDLTRISSVKCLERSRLDAILTEHKLAKSPFIDTETAVQLGKGLSAHALLTGAYMIAGDDIRIDVHLVSVETGEVPWLSRLREAKLIYSIWKSGWCGKSWRA
jgi:serine/threonine protein kinase